MRHSRTLFGSAIFLASFLLFLVDPMAAKQLLPLFGGSAAVWITCLVFFQTMLLVAYLYAHWLTKHSAASLKTPRRSLHFLLLTVAFASVILFAFPVLAPAHSSDHPFLAIFAALSLSVGLPFLALGATSPLLQVSLAHLENAPAPYRLFALSNLASLLALGLYPTAIEPHLTLHSQRLLWACG